MDTDYAAVGLFTVGLFWFVNPLYWPVLEAVGVAPLFDWLGAIGLVPKGSYYVGLGAAYVVGGLTGFWYAREGVPFRRALAVTLSGTLLLLVGVLGAFTLRYRTAGLTSVTFALGIVPALLTLPFGVAETGRQRRVAAAVGVGLLVPYAWWVVVNAGFPPVGPASTYAYASVGLLALLDLLWGLPLYWIGTRLRAARGDDAAAGPEPADT